MNKETRLEHYKTVLNMYETSSLISGICEILKCIRSEDHVDIEGDYLEFYSLKPKDRGLDQYWFSNRQERIDALKKCMAMLEVEIKVGDTVKITRKAVGDELDKVHWAQSMCEWVGKDGVVSETNGSLVKVTRSEDFWWFPLCVLEKVVTNTSQISTSSDILSTFKLGDVGVIIEFSKVSPIKSSAVQVPGGPTTCNYSLVTDLKQINMKKKVVVDGVEYELDLTPEQLAVVSKPTALPVSWEEVYEIDAPDWCVKCDGVVVDDMAGYVGMDEMNIASKARGKSLAAYAKLSVVVDYFNSITKKGVDKYIIEYDTEEESLIVERYISYLVNPLVINSKEIAEHILKHFKELLHVYLMTGK